MDVWESFEIIGPIRRIETIASGEGIRDLVYLEERFGRADWQKLKGFATVRLEDGYDARSRDSLVRSPWRLKTMGKDQTFS